jgi:chemotaxis protein histidine kinase CheA
VDQRKLERLTELASQLGSVEGALDRLAESLREQGVDPALAREAQRARSVLRRRTQELREGLLDARMAPLDEVFTRVATLVRDLAVERGTRVRLVTRGGDTRIDRALAGPVGGALLDLVRDAIGQAAAVRGDELAGAAQRPIAALEIGARVEGSRVRIHARLAEEGGARGVSIDERVLDTVRASLARVGATVIRADAGGSGLVHIEVPVTVVRVPALLFEAAGCLWAIPRDAAAAVRAFAAADVEHVEGRECLRDHAETIPLRRLDERVGRAAAAPGGASRSAEAPASTHAFLFASPRGRWALVVDRLLGREELVVTALGESLRGAVPGLAGAADLGGERIALMLDAEAWFASERVAGAAEAGAVGERTAPGESAPGVPLAEAAPALVVECAGARVALPLSRVSEVAATARVTPVPCAPRAVRGVVARHGTIVTVFDFAALLGYAPVTAEARTPIVLVEAGGELVGLAVERVVRVARDLAAESPHPAFVDPAPLVAARARLEP